MLCPLSQVYKGLVVKTEGGPAPPSFVLVFKPLHEMGTRDTKIPADMIPRCPVI